MCVWAGWGGFRLYYPVPMEQSQVRALDKYKQWRGKEVR